MSRSAPKVVTAMRGLQSSQYSRVDELQLWYGDATGRGCQKSNLSKLLLLYIRWGTRNNLWLGIKS